MNEQKLTDWFPPEVLPARPGWYQREWPTPSSIASPDFFNWRNWFIGYNGRLYKDPHLVPLRWRGLAEPPLTDWFDPDTPPEREGVYETDESDKDGRCFAHWDGEKFGYRCWEHIVKGGAEAAIQRAHEMADVSTNFPGLTRWRGLAVQP